MSLYYYCYYRYRNIYLHKLKNQWLYISEIKNKDNTGVSIKKIKNQKEIGTIYLIQYITLIEIVVTNKNCWFQQHSLMNSKLSKVQSNCVKLRSLPTYFEKLTLYHHQSANFNHVYHDHWFWYSFEFWIINHIS